MVVWTPSVTGSIVAILVSTLSEKISPASSRTRTGFEDLTLYKDMPKSAQHVR